MDNDGKIIQFKKRKVKSNILSNSDNVGTIIRGKDLTEYSNDFFQFKLSVPASWCTFGDKEMVAFKENNLHRVNLDDEKKKQALEEMSNRLHLLRSSPYPTRPADAADNPTVTCTATKRINEPNSKAIDFVQEVKELLLKGEGGTPYEIVQDIHPIIISGVRFEKMVVQSTVYFNRLVKLHYMSTLTKGYELVFTFLWMTENGLDEINNIVKSITFE